MRGRTQAPVHPPSGKEYLDFFRLFKLYCPLSVKGVTVRPKLGDFVHMFLNQHIEYAMLSLDPKTYASYLYTWGKFLGYHASQQILRSKHMYTMLCMMAGLMHEKLAKFKFYQSMFAECWTMHGAGIPVFAEIDTRTKKIKIQLHECSETAGLPRSKKALNIYSLGFLSGNLNCCLGVNLNFKENVKNMKDLSTCEFEGRTNMEYPKFDPPDKKELKKIKDRIIHNILSRKKIRHTLGDNVHLSRFQMFYLGLWFSSPGSHTLLYWVGKDLGKAIKKGLKTSDENKLKEILEYLKIGDIEISRNVAVIKECAFCAGASDIGKRVCSYMAGVFAGFFGKNVIETRCVAQGEDRCEFVII